MQKLPQKRLISLTWYVFNISIFLLVSSLLFFLLPKTTYSAEWYVSPSGTAGGNGSISSPWDLQTALSHPASVQPGDTIWLRGGTYSGTYTGILTGTSANPITVRQYSGERAILDGGTENAQTLTITGSYVYYWGFEIMRSDTNRVSSQTGSDPTDIIGDNGGGVWAQTGNNNKFINLIVHDTGQGYGVWTSALNTEIYGNIIYYNGWQAPDRGHGHGIYSQNDIGTKLFKNNIIFKQSGWGIHNYGVNGLLNNFDIEGNIIFNNGALASQSIYHSNILVGGWEFNIAQNPNVKNNYTYFDSNKSGGTNNIGYNGGCNNLNATDNYFAHGGQTALTLINCTNVAMSGNTFIGDINGFTSLDYPSNTYIATPTGETVYVRPNIYEPNRAHIVIYNWGGKSSVDVDASSVLLENQNYKVYDVENYFGNPIASGTYTGSSINIPMISTEVATPVGLSAPPHTPFEFGAFVLVGGAIASTSTPSSVSATTSISTSKTYSPTVKLVAEKTGTANVSVDTTFSGIGPAGGKIRVNIETPDGKIIPGVITVSQDGTWSWKTPYPLLPGEYSATFTAQDKKGNTGTTTLNFTVDENGVRVTESQQESEAVTEIIEKKSLIEMVIEFLRRITS